MLGSDRGGVPKKCARLLQPSQERTCGQSLKLIWTLVSAVLACSMKY